MKQRTTETVRQMQALASKTARRLRPQALVLCAVAVLSMLALSCYRLPLELYYNGDADVKVKNDWLSRFHERPENMLLMLARNDDSISFYDPTYRVDEWQRDLPSGIYMLTVMNRSFREYSTMRFIQTNSHHNIYAKANTYTISNEAAWDYGRTYIDEPERIGVATDTFYVAQTIDSLTFHDYRVDGRPDTLHVLRPQTVLPMTTQLVIRVKVRGISYMRQGGMQGYITGMADGFYLNQRWRGTDVGTLKLDKWEPDTETAHARRAEGQSEPNVGWMKCVCETFGLSHGRELLRWRTPENNYIKLHFTLLDGRTKDFSYLVGRDIRYKGDEGDLEYFDQTDVTLELNLNIEAPAYDDDEVPILPYAQPEGSGQFDAQVAPWGDDIDVTIPM